MQMANSEILKGYVSILTLFKPLYCTIFWLCH